MPKLHTINTFVVDIKSGKLDEEVFHLEAEGDSGKIFCAMLGKDVRALLYEIERGSEMPFSAQDFSSPNGDRMIMIRPEIIDYLKISPFIRKDG